jgi:uncharacterized membrane protein (UPF0136 family)
MITDSTILWGYIVLLVAGGLVGFLKANSKASLISSVFFAVILALCAMNVGPLRLGHAVWVLLFLLLFFTWRLLKSKKFMPNGLMVILTALALALPWLLRSLGRGI